MGDGVQIKLTGDMDVIAALREFRQELPKNPLRAAVKKAAQMLCDAIDMVTPVDTGNLLANTRVSATNSAHNVRGRVVINNAAFYWRFLELGWHDRKGVFHHLEYIAPRVRSLTTEAAQIVIDECERQVKKCQDKIVRTTAGSM